MSSSTSAVAVLAQGLRELRDFAEGPDGAELAERTGLTGPQIEAALGGERLPTREVTLALVQAWEGDVEAWREYWGQISELVDGDDEAEDGDKRAATPAPPERSIIVPIPEVEPDAEDAQDTEAEAEAEAAAVRARSAARAQLEANAQAAKAAAEKSASGEQASASRAAQDTTGAASDAEAQPSDAGKAEPARTENASGAQENSAGGDAGEAEQVHVGAAAPASGDRAADSAGGTEPARAEAPAGSGASSGTETPARAAVKVAGPQPRAAAETASSVPGQPPKPKRSLLARAGVPILLFAIGVGVGAFGDHALNSKQSSTDTSASVPPVSHTSSSLHTSAAASAGTSSSPAATPTSSVNPTATTPTGTSSTTSTAALGSVLGSYSGIQLASGYSINFLTDPYHPAAGTSNGPDTMGFFAGSFVDGRFYADRVAVLNPTDTGSYTSCLDDTRYQHDVLLSQVSEGSSFCITTGTGHLVLVTVKRMPSSTDANPYAVLDVTVWQSS